MPLHANARHGEVGTAPSRPAWKGHRENFSFLSVNVLNLWRIPQHAWSTLPAGLLHQVTTAARQRLDRGPPTPHATEKQGSGLLGSMWAVPPASARTAAAFAAFAAASVASLLLAAAFTNAGNAAFFVRSVFTEASEVVFASAAAFTNAASLTMTSFARSAASLISLALGSSVPHLPFIHTHPVVPVQVVKSKSILLHAGIVAAAVAPSAAALASSAAFFAAGSSTPDVSAAALASPLAVRSAVALSAAALAPSCAVFSAAWAATSAASAVAAVLAAAAFASNTLVLSGATRRLNGQFFGRSEEHAGSGKASAVVGCAAELLQ